MCHRLASIECLKGRLWLISILSVNSSSLSVGLLSDQDRLSTNRIVHGLWSGSEAITYCLRVLREMYNRPSLWL